MRKNTNQLVDHNTHSNRQKGFPDLVVRAAAVEVEVVSNRESPDEERILRDDTARRSEQEASVVVRREGWTLEEDNRPHCVSKLMKRKR